MSTNFPTSLDTLTNPTPTDYLNSPSHSGQHANANDAIEALEAKVGINGSSVSTSIDRIITTGWIPYTAVVPTRASSDDPTYVLTFAGVDLTSKMSVGMKVKFTQNGATVYGIITKIAYSTNTTVTLYCGTDYDVSDTSTYPISEFYYSTQKAPFGFPMQPSKWSVVVIDTSIRAQASPSASVWYNPGGANEQIVVPIGAWKLSYKAIFEAEANGNSQTVYGTLSTSASTESNSKFTISDENYNAVAVRPCATGYAEDDIEVSSKTTYYLNIKTSISGTSNLWVRGDNGTTVIRAVCSYL